MAATWTWRVTPLTQYLSSGGPGSWLVLPVVFGGALLMMLGLLIWRLRTPWRWWVGPGLAAASQAQRHVLELR